MKKKLSRLLIIYGYNLKLILLLLYTNLIYYIKNYNINLNKTYLKLSLKDKIKNVLKLKKRDFWLFLFE